MFGVVIIRPLQGIFTLISARKQTFSACAKRHAAVNSVMTELMNATMEEEVEEESAVMETPKPGGSSLGVVPSLTAQCCAFLRMKSFEELGRELGKEKLLMATEAAGTEASSAGKIRRRSGGGRQKSWVDVMAGRDYLGE